MKTLVNSSKKIAIVSKLLEKIPDELDAIHIDVIDKRLENNDGISLKTLGEFAKKIVEEIAPNKRPLEMSVILLDADEISLLNKEHLSKSGPTDVLAFPIDDSDGEMDDTIYLMGDVCICPEVAAGQAKEKDLNFRDEIALLLTHGILHLLGYDHYEESEEIEMKKMERALIERYSEHLRVHEI